MNIDVFIQARMSSRRLPGKVLLPIGNMPLIYWTIKSAQMIASIRNIVVLTSNETSDDVICKYVNIEFPEIKLFRGSLTNVFERFDQAVQRYNPDYILRICGDSPFILSGEVNNQILDLKDQHLVTNLFPRSFPKGLSIELIRADLFKYEYVEMTSHHKEHVSAYFYENAHRYNIQNFGHKQEFVLESYAIDTEHDYKNMNKFIEKYEISDPRDFVNLMNKW